MNKSRNTHKIKYIFLIMTFLFISLSYFLFLILDEKTLFFLSHEDGIIESAGAVFFLIASIIFFTLYLKSKKQNVLFLFKAKKNIFFLLLAIILFLGFAEEISWGQRIFNIETPDFLKNISGDQVETSFHTIRIFDKDYTSTFFKVVTPSRIFGVFWLIYCIVIPIAVKFSSLLNILVQRIKLPIVPIWLGTFFFANYLIHKVIALFYSENPLHFYLTEIKESNSAFLFLMVSLVFLQINRINNSPDS